MVFDERVYIIAEVGVNHNGSLDMAKELVDEAVKTGADAVKFQTFKAEDIVSRTSPKAEYQKRTTGSDETQFEMIKKLELDKKSHEILNQYCEQRGIQFLSTPFDIESVNLLADEMDLPYIKIPSGEITNAPLLLKVATTGKPVILSTGMCTLEEIKDALGVLAFGYLKKEGPSLEAFGNILPLEEAQRVLREKVVLLHCVTEYPTPFSQVNLKAMDTIKNTFNLPVGFSDHTLGISIPIAAVARGAVVVEKHLTLDRNLPGPDHRASLEPGEFRDMVDAIRQVEEALGSGFKVPAPCELKNITVARKSLVAGRDIRKGENFSELNLSIKRPGTGISPMNYWDWLGKVSERDYLEDEEVGE